MLTFLHYGMSRLVLSGGFGNVSVHCPNFVVQQIQPSYGQLAILRQEVSFPVPTGGLPKGLHLYVFAFGSMYIMFHAWFMGLPFLLTGLTIGMILGCLSARV